MDYVRHPGLPDARSEIPPQANLVPDVAPLTPSRARERGNECNGSFSLPNMYYRRIVCWGDQYCPSPNTASWDYPRNAPNHGRPGIVLLARHALAAAWIRECARLPQQAIHKSPPATAGLLKLRQWSEHAVLGPSFNPTRTIAMLSHAAHGRAPQRRMRVKDLKGLLELATKDMNTARFGRTS